MQANVRKATTTTTVPAGYGISRKHRKYVRKSYFAVSTEVLALYRTRAISAVDVRVFSYLSNARMNGKWDGVRVTQKQIAFICGISVKTVAASTERLYRAGLIANIEHIIVPHKMKKYETTCYDLKPLPKRGYILIPRRTFDFTMSNKMFAMYLFFCHAQSFEYNKSWNSYNDITRELGYCDNARSEVIRLVKQLAEIGLIEKRTRKLKKSALSVALFVDNIYRVVNRVKEIVRKVWRKKSAYVNTYGNMYGSAYGNTYGNGYGNVYGNVYGNSYGNAYGNSYGNVYGNSYGNAYGNSYRNTYATEIRPVERSVFFNAGLARPHAVCIHLNAKCRLLNAGFVCRSVPISKGKYAVKADTTVVFPTYSQDTLDFAPYPF